MKYLPLLVVLLSVADSLIILIAMRIGYKHAGVMARLGLGLLLVGVISFIMQAITRPETLFLGHMFILVGVAAVYCRRIWLASRPVTEDNWVSDTPMRQKPHGHPSHYSKRT